MQLPEGRTANKKNLLIEGFFIDNVYGFVRIGWSQQVSDFTTFAAVNIQPF
jgi:hypothetical protein